MADSESGEIAGDLGGFREAEFRAELDAIGRERSLRHGPARAAKRGPRRFDRSGDDFERAVEGFKPSEALCERLATSFKSSEVDFERVANSFRSLEVVCDRLGDGCKSPEAGCNRSGDGFRSLQGRYR
jgi:hypothetical protein